MKRLQHMPFNAAPLDSKGHNMPTPSYVVRIFSALLCFGHGVPFAIPAGPLLALAYLSQKQHKGYKQAQ